jgi:hypothetical protein
MVNEDRSPRVWAQQKDPPPLVEPTEDQKLDDRVRKLMKLADADLPSKTPSKTTQSTAAASSGAAAAFVVILCWFVSLWHVTIPAEVAASITVIVGVIVHWIGIKYGITTDKETP